MLDIKNLNVFANGIQILHNINLTVNEGERHVIMGRNGSGKSTLLNAIMGRPGLEVTGQVKFLDIENILDIPVDQRVAAGIFLSVQSPPELAGIGNARLLQGGLEAIGHNVNLSELLTKINQLGKELALPDRWAMRAFNVGASGGERKKNELLHLMILNAKLCLLDELEAGLDVDAGLLVNNMLKDTLMTMLMVSHNPLISPTDVHIMHNGRLVMSGTAGLISEVLANGYDSYAL